MHEYEDIGDPDRIEQGDVIEWLPKHSAIPWRRFGVVVTADCDLAWEKHGGVISYVPGLMSSDFIWEGFRERFFSAKRDEALQGLVKLLNAAIKRQTSQESKLSRLAIQDWLGRVGRESLLDEVGVRENAREKLSGVIDQILVCDEILNTVNRRSIGTPYRRAKGTPLLSWWVVDAGRGFRAAGGVGRA